MSSKLEEVSKIWPLIDNTLALPHKEEDYQQFRLSGNLRKGKLIDQPLRLG
jgi:hypothetical protein